MSVVLFSQEASSTLVSLLAVEPDSKVWLASNTFGIGVHLVWHVVAGFGKEVHCEKGGPWSFRSKVEGVGSQRKGNVLRFVDDATARCETK